MRKKITRFAGLILCLSLALPASVNAQDEDSMTGLTCGPKLTCDASSQYCSVVVGGPKGMATGHTCVDVPNATAPLTCASIRVPVGSECADTPEGVVVTTQAP